MGLFDRLVDLEIVCPYCGNGASIELQTKDLKPGQNSYYVYYPRSKCFYDTFNSELFPSKEQLGNLQFVNATADCRSPLCFFVERMREYVEYGYTRGLGRMWDVRYKVKKGRLIGPAQITSKIESIDVRKLKERFIEKVTKPKQLKEYLKRRKICGDELGIAVLQYSWSADKNHFKICHPSEV